MGLVKITRNDSRIKARVGSGKDRMIYAVTEQVIKDSNYYCRQDQGTLISSSYYSSIPEKGLAIWNTPYAKRVYYTGTPSKDVNANASLMWCEKARSSFGSDWDLIAHKTFSGGMGS